MCTCGYVKLVYYKERSLLHVSATYCGHLQGSYIYLSFKEHLPEDGHTKWPKHVGVYVDYNIFPYMYKKLLAWLYLFTAM